MKLQRIEEQLHEIVFLTSVVTAFSIFLSGILYLFLSTNSLMYLLGEFGAQIQQGFFTGFGYAFFYLAVMILHLGHIFNLHIYRFKDIKIEYPVLAYSALAHMIILALFSSFLSVIQIYLDLPSRTALPYGSGGLAGLTMGGSLYQGIGLYGALIAIFAVGLITAMLADFINLPELLHTTKEVTKTTSRKTINGLRIANHNLQNQLQLLLQKGDLLPAHATGKSHKSKNWISRRMITDHFHIYPEIMTDKKETVSKDTKIAKKKTTTRASNPKKKATKKKTKAAVISKKKTAKKTATKKKKVAKKATTTSRRKKSTRSTTSSRT